MEISFMITRDIKMDDRDVECLASALEETLNDYINDAFNYPEGIYTSARKTIFRKVTEWMLYNDEYKWAKES